MPPRRFRSRPWLLVALAALPAAALLGIERWSFGDLAGFPLDDAWIHLRLARHLAAGDGLGFGAGRVAASTAPLWTAWLSLLASAGVPLPLAAKLSGLATHLLLLAASWLLARRLELPPRVAALAVVLVGLTDWLVFDAASGMEVGLATALVLAGIARHLRERRAPEAAPLSFLLFALAALARPEALLLLPLALLDRVDRIEAKSGRWSEVSRARSPLAGLAVAALVLVPVGLTYVVFSGSPLPTTLAAKSPGPAAGVPSLDHLRTVLTLLFASQPLPVLLSAAGALELLRRAARGDAKSPGLLLPLWTAALPLAASALATPGAPLPAGNFGRYFHPLLPCVVLLGLLGLEPLRRTRWRSPLARRAAVVLALLLLALPPLARTARILPLYLTARANVEASDGAAARWLRPPAAAGARIAAVDIGRLGWELADRPGPPLLDLGGIADPELLRFLRRQRIEHGLDWQRALALWLDRQRPDLIVVFPAWFPLAERDPARFPALARFRIPHNVAMAGDELVVYATPWTRPSIRKELLP